MGKHEVVLAGNISNEYTEYEKLVGNIWSEVLGLNELNITDSFFDLGEHSLIVIQMLELFEQKGSYDKALANLERAKKLLAKYMYSLNYDESIFEKVADCLNESYDNDCCFLQNIWNSSQNIK